MLSGQTCPKSLNIQIIICSFRVTPTAEGAERFSPLQQLLLTEGIPPAGPGRPLNVDILSSNYLNGYCDGIRIPGVRDAVELNTPVPNRSMVKTHTYNTDHISYRGRAWNKETRTYLSTQARTSLLGINLNTCNIWTGILVQGLPGGRPGREREDKKKHQQRINHDKNNPQFTFLERLFMIIHVEQGHYSAIQRGEVNITGVLDEPVWRTQKKRNLNRI